jgi:hypothetical protein
MIVKAVKSGMFLLGSDGIKPSPETTSDHAPFKPLILNRVDSKPMKNGQGLKTRSVRKLKLPDNSNISPVDDIFQFAVKKIEKKRTCMFPPGSP